MKTSKRICKNGSITLPKQIRGEAGLFPGNAVDIETSTDGSQSPAQAVAPRKGRVD